MIRKKSIRSIDPYARLIPDSKSIYVGVVNPSETQLKRIGFSDNLKDGETVLPKPIGRTSLFNAEGKYIVHKDRPMETAYRTVEWSWTEWHGRYDSVEKTDFRDVPYKRYPRTYVTAPSLELTLFTDNQGQRVILTPLIFDWKNNNKATVHSVNLILDAFGECTFFDEERNQIINSPLHRLNWKILPEGQYPFTKLQELLKDELAKVKEGNRSFVNRRLERINSFNPEFTAIGQGGFSGYVIFGFPKKKIYVLESILYGNATYVLGEDWERISKLTKAEILDGSLHEYRVIHLRNWFEKIGRLLG